MVPSHRPSIVHDPSLDRQSGIISVEPIEERVVTVADFRRIALSLEGAEEGSHMGSPDFRVGGRIFATLASQAEGYGNLKLTPEQQADFVREAPEIFIPIKGGWGRMGMTHIVLAKANPAILEGALRAAWKLRVDQNQRAKRPTKHRVKGR
ncbi:MAG: MmcQ/YjbR family DNA-binding protein [Acidobacteriaceae bacterium]